MTEANRLAPKPLFSAGLAKNLLFCVSGTVVVKIFLQATASVDRPNAQVTAASQSILRPPGTLPPLIVNYTASSVLILQLALSVPVLPLVITVAAVATAAFALGNLDAEGAKEAQPSATQTFTGRIGHRGFPSHSRSN
jgi:hypothetical protein